MLGKRQIEHKSATEAEVKQYLELARTRPEDPQVLARMVHGTAELLQRVIEEIGFLVTEVKTLKSRVERLDTP